jgi:hypothetical protein
MKYSIIVFLLFVVMAAHAQDTIPQVPKAFTAAVIKALKENKLQDLTIFIMDTAQVNTFAIAFQSENISAVALKERLKTKINELPERFKEIRADSTIVWAAIEHVSTEVDYTSTITGGGITIKLYDIIIKFKDPEGNTGTISFRQIFYLNDKWLLPAKTIRLKVRESEAKRREKEELEYEANLVVRTDTLIWFNNIQDGIAHAAKNNTYIIWYHQPKACSSCVYTVRKLLTELKSAYNYYDTKTFNSKFTLVIAGEKDTTALQQAGVKNFPGATFFTAGKKELLGYKYNAELNILLQQLLSPTYYTEESILQSLRVHEFNTVLPAKIRAAKFDTAMVNNYLTTFFAMQATIQRMHTNQYYQDKQLVDYNASLNAPVFVPLPDSTEPAIMEEDIIRIIAPDDSGKPQKKKNEKKKKQPVSNKQKGNNTYAEKIPPTTPVPPPVINEPVVDTLGRAEKDPEIPLVPGNAVNPYAPDTTITRFSTSIDTAFILEALDSLTVKYNYPDAALAKKINRIITLLDDYYCPFYLSNMLTPQQGLFKPTISFAYLLQHYNVFKKLETTKNNYYEERFVNLYELLSKRINRFIRTNEQSDSISKQKALLYQASFVNAMQPLEHLEKPLFIQNLLLTIPYFNATDSLFETIALPYLNSIAGKPSLPQFIQSISLQLGKLHEKATDYIVWNYGGTPGHSTTSGYKYYYPTYFKECFGNLLNDAAWRICEANKEQPLLQQATRFIKAAITLDKNNPYYTDTYAHILYKTGQKPLATVMKNKAQQLVKQWIKDGRLTTDDAKAFSIGFGEIK